MRGRWTSAVGVLVVLGLLLASALLAAVRLTDPGSRRLIELVTLTPLGVPFAALGLLGAARWATPRGARPVAVLVAACLLAVHAWWLAPLYAGRRPAAGAASMVVLAQNFEYGDADALVEMVRREDVDVLVLTDVGSEQLARLIGAGVGARLPWFAGVDHHEAHGSAVVLSRFPVGRTALLYDDSEARVVELEVPGVGPVTVVAVHTKPPYQPEAWRTDHQRIRAGLADIRSDGDAAVVLAGDLNATLAHAPLRRLLALGFADAAAQVNAGWSPTWPAGGRAQLLGATVPSFAAIDHVLTSPRLVVTDARTLTLLGADHRAVLATISGAG